MSIKEILTNEEIKELNERIDEILNQNDMPPVEQYERVEDIMLDYGLEMDYFPEVIRY